MQLQSYQPEPEVPIDYEALPLSYIKAEKAENNEPPSESSDKTIMDVSENSKLQIPQSYDIVVERELSDASLEDLNVPENNEIA